MDQLNYTDSGKGEKVIVLLHYFGGSSNTWEKVIDQLTDEYRCIAIDLPGFGRSQDVYGELSVNGIAEMLNLLLDFIPVDKYILAGHSMGGKIAMALAANYPAKISSLILIAPSPPTPEPMTDKGRKSLLEAHGNKRKVEALLRMVCGPSVSETDLENTTEDNIITSQGSWNWWLESGSKENISDQLKNISAPLLVISGENDPNLTTAFLTQTLSPLFPAASFKEIPVSGHLIPIESPHQLVKEMLAILLK